MLGDRIEYADRGYFRVTVGSSKSNRKLRSRKLSFESIKSRWNNYKLNKLNEQLAAQKENLVEMEFSNEQLKSGEKRQRTEAKILRKTKAIARLESKVNFLETGTYYGEDYIDSRAIKLKTLMMKNLVYNRDNLYGLTEEVAQQIISGEQPGFKEEIPVGEKTPVNKVIDEESEKIGAKVREILAEKEREKAAQVSTQEQQQPAVETVTPENVSDQIPNGENNNSNTQSIVGKDEVTHTIAEEMRKIDVEPTINSDKVAEAIEREMNKIRVSRNESSNAKVNKFINEDGTYRMKREDIDEDFRITRFDRNKLSSENKNPTDDQSELDIQPFGETTARKTPDVESPRKAITALTEIPKVQFPAITPPTIKEAKKDEEKREVPIVVPDRVEKQELKQQAPSEVATEAVSNPNISGDLGALMARVMVLKAERETITSLQEDAERKVMDTEESYNDTKRRLAEYADQLEKACNVSYQAKTDAEKRAAATEAQINAMLAMMENGETESIKPEQGKQGRIR